jgi:hypothetical protein
VFTYHSLFHLRSHSFSSPQVLSRKYTHFTQHSQNTTQHLQVKVNVNVMLRPTVSWPVSLGIKHPSGLTTRFLFLSDSCVFNVGRSLTRGRVCRLQFLQVLASAVILGSKSRGTRDRYFTVSDSRLPFSLPPTTRRPTVEVFEPASTWEVNIYNAHSTPYVASAGPA